MCAATRKAPIAHIAMAIGFAIAIAGTFLAWQTYREGPLAFAVNGLGVPVHHSFRSPYGDTKSGDLEFDLLSGRASFTRVEDTGGEVRMVSTTIEVESPVFIVAIALISATLGAVGLVVAFLSWASAKGRGIAAFAAWSGLGLHAVLALFMEGGLPSRIGDVLGLYWDYSLGPSFALLGFLAAAIARSRVGANAPAEAA